MSSREHEQQELLLKSEQENRSPKEELGNWFAAAKEKYFLKMQTAIMERKSKTVQRKAKIELILKK